MPRHTRLIPLAGAVALSAGLSAFEMDQVLTGELLVEGVNRNNYTDGEDARNDRVSKMQIRAALGTEIEFDDRAMIKLGFVYDAEGGDRSDPDEDLRESVTLNDAYLQLKQFIRPELHVRIGRQPVAWNLRKNDGGFIYDSRADDPVVTRWDGVRAYWEVDNFTISPFAFIIDEATEPDPDTGERGRNSDDTYFWGITGDWLPDRMGDDRMFLTGSLSVARKVPLAGGETGDELHTYYAGAEWKLAHDIDLYAEGGVQDGEVDNSRDFSGWALSVGAQWAFPDASLSPVINAQYDHFSGNEDGDDDYKAFVVPWEGVSDTYIVEHERYGELSELLVGNLEAVKLTIEQAYFEEILTLKAVYGYYKTVEDVGGENDFGNEFDLTLSWKYNDFTTFRAWGAVFLPGEAYRAVAPASETDDDTVTLFGISGHVTF
ncbi:MAG: alginate export family protein [Planctomycetota bacterium]